jgi:hypothetical protein
MSEIHYQEYRQTMGQVSPVPGQRGRPKKFPDTLKQFITLAVSSNACLSVRAAAAVRAIPISQESIPTIR